jgi:CheY-like chemotaxis protein
LDSSTIGEVEGESMSANILVVEYEPRYVEHVRKALADPGFILEIAGNMDDAVNRCANFEPAVVIITSVLPNLKIEDAITQLRARAGLRATPFLILMSGYRGPRTSSNARSGPTPFASGLKSWCGTRRIRRQRRRSHKKCSRPSAAARVCLVTTPE